MCLTVLVFFVFLKKITTLGENELTNMVSILAFFVAFVAKTYAKRQRGMVDMTQPNIHSKFEGSFAFEVDYLNVCYPVANYFGGGGNPMTVKQLNDAEIPFSYCGVCADWVFSQISSDDNWDEMIRVVQKHFLSQFTSFKTTSKWRDNNRHVVLESELFDIAVIDAGDSVMWMVSENSNISDIEWCDDVFATQNIQKHFLTYLEAVKTALLPILQGLWVNGETQVAIQAA